VNGSVFHPSSFSGTPMENGAQVLRAAQVEKMPYM
jgi:hypothetical protein